jgi:hypothetical protein
VSLIFLNTLEPNHILRNTPLGEIKAKYRWKKASDNIAWRTVEVGAPKLVSYTFNQLGPAWTESDWWVTDDM